MKKILLLLSFAIALSAMVSCSKSPEAEFIDASKGVIELQTTTAEKLDKAATGKDAGDILLNWAKDMRMKGDQVNLSEKRFNKSKDFDPKFLSEVGALEQAGRQSSASFSAAFRKAKEKFRNEKEYQSALMILSQTYHMDVGGY